MSVKDLRQIVAAKRDGRTLDDAEVEAFVEGYTDGSISDALGERVPDGVPDPGPGRRGRRSP